MVIKSENEYPPKKDASPANSTADPLLTVDEVASFLRLKAETIRAMARRGELTAIKVGKSWRFRRVSISDYLSQLDDVVLRKP